MSNANTLLYLEDDEALAQVTQRGLERRGYSVCWCQTLSQLVNRDDLAQYSQVLLDLKIGSETSLGVIETIRRASNAPIIILSGYGTIRTAVQAIRLGAIDFLTKPCSIDDILAAFGAVITDTTAQPNTCDLPLTKPSLKSVEWETIQRALDENKGNISAAARQLKMHRRTLQRKLQKRHLEQDA